MGAAGTPDWVIREDASVPVLVALYLRQVLGVRAPDELSLLRGIEPHSPRRSERDQLQLEAQWSDYWAMTVEPRAHPSAVPLNLVPGFDSLVALPVEGAEDLLAAITPYAADAIDYASDMHRRYRRSIGSGVAYRAYAGAIAEHERRVGRRAHAFELNVQVLPLTQRGVWWIGSVTVAVTDGLRGDIAAFDSAINPIIAELA